MLSWKEIVQDYLIKYADEIRGVTRPLRDHFGIDYFTYHRIDTRGNYVVLLDRPDWAEHYVAEQFFLHDPYLRHPDVYQEGLCQIEAHAEQKVLKDGKDRFLDLGFVLIEKSSDFVEICGFSGNRARCSLNQLCLNHSKLLKSFTSHFKKKLNPLLSQMKEESISLPHLKGKDFYVGSSIDPKILKTSHRAYLNDLGMQAELEKVVALSKRERQCIKLLLEGKSAKETGGILGLSPRTVESYFDTIKNKLSCWNKQEVFSVAKIFEELGLLP